MAASKLNPMQVRRWALNAVSVGKGNELSKLLAEEFKVSRPTAARVVKKLVDEKWLRSSGGTRPIYEFGENREVFKSYPIPGIDENLIWVKDFQPMFAFNSNVAGIVHYGMTEMLNNANDHSEGDRVYASMKVLNGNFHISIRDNGVGVFEKISKALELPDRRLAILELSKGKFTTDPSRHSGEGIFFTSKMFDHFSICANDLYYDHDSNDEPGVLLEADGATDSLLPQGKGTLIFMEISADSARTAKKVFDEFSGTDGNYGFDKTLVPVRLAKVGDENLISRSQAKRLVARFEGFKTVLLDFSNISEIGQAFADEVFRVFAGSHPNVDLLPIHANEAVMQMISRARTHVRAIQQG